MLSSRCGYEVQSVGCFQRQMGQVDLGVGDMAKIFYHGICNFISRFRYISRFIICRVTRFEFVKKRTLQRRRNVSTDLGYTV